MSRICTCFLSIAPLFIVDCFASDSLSRGWDGIRVYWRSDARSTYFPWFEGWKVVSQGRTFRRSLFTKFSLGLRLKDIEGDMVYFSIYLSRTFDSNYLDFSNVILFRNLSILVLVSLETSLSKKFTSKIISRLFWSNRKALHTSNNTVFPSLLLLFNARI